MNRTKSMRAFSLIEILVSILILGLGLLGLGSLFPVIIREQRQSTDSVLGVIAANNTRALLDVQINQNSSVEYLQETNPAGVVTEQRVEYRGWAGLLGGSPSDVANTFSNGDRIGMWAPSWGKHNRAEWPGNTPGALRNEPEALELGNLVFNGLELRGENAGADEFPAESQGIAAPRKRVSFPPSDVRVSSRLDPSGDGTGASPSYVWDMVARRVPQGGTPDAPAASIDDGLQFAVFVRRVDPGIRVNPGESLRGALVSDTGSQRLPVGAIPGDPRNDEQAGLATLDGTDGRGGLNYSWPLEALAPNNRSRAAKVFDFYDVAVPPSTQTLPSAEQRQWLENVNVDRAPGRAMAQPGQKLIDNLGNVYTVERIEPALEETRPGTGNYRRIRLNPAPAFEDIRLDTTPSVGTPRRRIQQFILTPQVPAAAYVIDAPRKVVSQ